MKIAMGLILPGFAWLTAAWGAPLQVDFSTLATGQAGWETINGTGSPSGTFSGYTDLAGAGNDITVSLANIAYNRRYDNGGVNDDLPGTDLDAMYGDLLFRNNDSATVDVTISGLLAGTYQITTHHLIDSPSPGQFDLLVTDANGATQDFGNFTMGTGKVTAPAAFNPTLITFEVVSNGTDDIILQMDQTVASSGGNTGGWFGFNGLEIAIPEPSPTLFQLVITPNSANPGNYDFSWNSQSGKVYDLVSATDLNTAPSTWAVWNANADIAATPDTNTLTNVPGGGDPKRFFAVVEKDAPPPP